MIGPGIKGDCPARYSAYLCTRDLGHRGEHVAHGVTGIIVARWAPARKPINRERRHLMSIRISTQHGTYEGRTVESIIRREYGRKAMFRASADRNSPDTGLIVTPYRGSPGVYKVEATVRWIEGDSLAARQPINF